MRIYVLALTLAALALCGCGRGGDDHAGHDHGEHAGHDHGEHAGHDHGEHAGDDHGEAAGHSGHDHGQGGLLEIGDELAHLRVVHDAAAGKLTVNVLSDDAKTPLELTVAPRLNLITGAGRVQLAMTGSGSTFSATHPVLNKEPDGRIVVELDGTTWQIPLTAHAH